MENEASLWSKTSSELTVSDHLKVAAITTTVCVAAPFAIMMAVGGATTLYEKLKERKAKKTTVIPVT